MPGMSLAVVLVAAAAVALLPAAAPASAARIPTHYDTTPFHTSSELASSFEALSRDCAFVSVGEERAPGGVALPYARVADPSRSPRHRVLMFFGEHARELVSPETALVMARTLCEAPGGARGAEAREAARSALGVAEFLMFYNCNPRGRARVEDGEYCLRANEHGVDLNRNWNDHWQNDAGNRELIRMQSFGGRTPFSEAETVVLKRAAVRFRPTVFMTVHSGTLGIFIPYAWNGKEPTSREVDEELRTVIGRVNERYCNCPAGAAGKEVGYLCPGTCLDWMYDKLNTQFSYGFEIYGGDTGYTSQKGASALVEVGGKEEEEEEEEEERAGQRVRGDGKFPQPASADVAKCLWQFNPSDAATFKATTRHWATALIAVVNESADVDGKQ